MAMKIPESMQPIHLDADESAFWDACYVRALDRGASVACQVADDAVRDRRSRCGVPPPCSELVDEPMFFERVTGCDGTGRPISSLITLQLMNPTLAKHSALLRLVDSPGSVLVSIKPG